MLSHQVVDLMVARQGKKPTCQTLECDKGCYRGTRLGPIVSGGLGTSLQVGSCTLHSFKQRTDPAALDRPHIHKLSLYRLCNQLCLSVCVSVSHHLSILELELRSDKAVMQISFVMFI